MPSDKIRKGEISAAEFGRIRDAAGEIQQAPLYIDDTGGISMAKLAARARRLKRTAGLDLIIVNYFRGAAEASVYAVASQCALLLLLIPSTVSQVLQSKMVAQDLRGEFTCRVARGTSLLLAVACLLSIPMAVLVARVYGPDFSMLPQMLWILLPGVFFVGMQQVLTQYFFATGLSWRLPLSWVLTLVISLGLDLWFVPRYGAVGAAVVSTVSYALISVATFVFFKTRTNNGLRAVLLPRPDELGELFRSLVNQPEQG